MLFVDADNDMIELFASIMSTMLSNTVAMVKLYAQLLTVILQSWAK